MDRTHRRRAIKDVVIPMVNELLEKQSAGLKAGEASRTVYRDERLFDFDNVIVVEVRKSV
jgi:hypothetical protein